MIEKMPMISQSKEITKDTNLEYIYNRLNNLYELMSDQKNYIRNKLNDILGEEDCKKESEDRIDPMGIIAKIKDRIMDLYIVKEDFDSICEKLKKL